jgi:hypothetical protein
MERNMKVFVVLGETGEYSDRNVQVCGVFATEQEARSMMLKRMEVRRLHNLWHERMIQELRRLQPGLGQYTTENQQEAERRAGPEPEYEYSERVSLHAGELGEWGTDFGGLPEVSEEAIRITN